MIHHGLFFEFPTRFETFRACFVRLPNNPAWFDASTHEQIRVVSGEMVTAARSVHFWGAAEFVDNNDQSFIQDCLSRRVSRHFHKVLNEVSQGSVQPGSA